jgi:hypothetical protein
MPTVRSSMSIGSVRLLSQSKSARRRLVLPCFPSPSRNTRVSLTGTPPCTRISRKYARTGNHPLLRIWSGTSTSNLTSVGSTFCSHSRRMAEQGWYQITGSPLSSLAECRVRLLPFDFLGGAAGLTYALLSLVTYKFRLIVSFSFGKALGSVRSYYLWLFVWIHPTPSALSALHYYNFSHKCKVPKDNELSLIFTGLMSAHFAQCTFECDVPPYSPTGYNSRPQCSVPPPEIIQNNMK